VFTAARVWPGGDAPVLADTAVVVDDAGVVVGIGPIDRLRVHSARVPTKWPWIGPGIVDAHVHLAFGTPVAMRSGGVVAVRDLGAPRDRAALWRAPHGDPVVAVAGPLLTGPGGYPSRSWGKDGFAAFVASPEEARAVVRDLADEVDVVKVALEPSGGAVPSLDEVRAAVDTAHSCGLAVTAHALTEEMVLRALDAEVDELCHTPSERLSPATVERIAAAGVPVVSTIETLGRRAARNAAALVAAGVTLRYGTDLGNSGTRPGADDRELRRLADAGLGNLGALRAATDGAAAAFGFPKEVTGRIEVGHRALAVILPGDPTVDLRVFRTPLGTF
jgi:imidazolonepropionase-like amidohydrolase